MEHHRAQQRSVRRNLWALAQMIYHVFAPWHRRWRVRWGARDDEPEPGLPGEELIPEPAWEFTHGVSIAAPPEAVWPWIVQIGQGRGGFYSFERLEDLVGCHIVNTDTILPEFQNLEVGDEIRLHPTAPALHVAVVEPGRSLVLRSEPGNDAPGSAATHTTDSLWAFHLRPDAAGTCRLIERGKSASGASTTERLFFSPLFFEPIGFVMSREMLLGIKERAEAAPPSESKT